MVSQKINTAISNTVFNRNNELAIGRPNDKNIKEEVDFKSAFQVLDHNRC